MMIDIHDAFARWLLFLLASVGLCVIAMLTTGALRNRSAAARAMVWQSLAVSLLALAFVSVLPWGYALPSSLPLISQRDSLHRADQFGSGSTGHVDPLPMIHAEPIPKATLTPKTALESRLDGGSAGKNVFDVSAERTSESMSTRSSAGSRSEPVQRVFLLKALVLFVWSVGSIALFARFAASHFAARGQVRKTCEMPSRRLLQILRSVSSPRPRLLVSELAATPAVVGLARPSILLPSIANRWSDERVKMVLLHECAHIARRDTVWHALSMLSCCLTWPNPLAWWGLRQYIQEREQACDDRVIQQGHAPIAYGEMLVDLAASCSRRLDAIHHPSVAMARPPIQQRLSSILRANTDRSPSTRYQCLLMVASFLAFAMTLGALRPGWQDTVRAQDIQQNAEPDQADANQNIGGPTTGDEPSDTFEGVRYRVENDDGAPIEAAEIKLLRWTGKMEATKFVRMTRDNGRTQFAKIPRGNIYARITADGYVPYLALLRSPSDREQAIILSRPANASLIVTDANGDLVEGAELQYLLYNDINGTKTFVNSSVASALPIAFSSSDSQGRLDLPALPEGVNVRISVIHPDWASAVIELDAVDGVSQSVALQRGARVSLSVESASDQPDLEGRMVEITMLHSGDFRGDGGVFSHAFPIRDGKVQFTTGQFNFTEIRPKMDGYFIGPLMMNFPNAPIDELNLIDKKQTSLTLHAHKKVRVRGRVLDYQGDPIRGVDIQGSLIDSELMKPGQPVDELSQLDRMRAVTVAGSATSGRDGFYEIELAAGTASIEAMRHGFYADEQGVTFEVDATGDVVPPDVTLLPIPNLSGWIRDENGQSADNVIVRMVSKGRGDARPVAVTGATGEFKLKMTRIPYAAEGEGLETTAYVMAFDPTRMFGDIVEVDLLDPDQTKDIAMQLQPKQEGFFLNPLGIEPKKRELSGEVVDYVARMNERHASGAPGNAVPNAEEGTWLNTDAKSLEDFRGRFVLLDFWFIGCGPCHRDMPQLKAAHAGFPEDKFVVVGVHNNSSTPAQVSEFLDKQSIEYATVVDDNRGRIAAQFVPLGLRGYPFYILLDPNGRIVHNDAFSSATSNSLRMQKLELIHDAMLSWNW